MGTDPVSVTGSSEWRDKTTGESTIRVTADRASTEGLRPMTLADVVTDVMALSVFSVPTGDYIDRADVLDILQGYAYSLATEELLALRDTGPRPDSGIEAERLARAEARYNEANHSPEDAEEHWRSYLRHAEGVAAEYARLSTPRTETSEPTRAQVEQAFIDGSVEGSPIDHDGTPRTETSE